VRLAASGSADGEAVTARPMIMRWISEVPSKMVKIVDLMAVFAGQRPAWSVVSARVQHRLSERNDGFRSARVRFQVPAGLMVLKRRRGRTT
jgi:hypothetical protein